MDAEFNAAKARSTAQLLFRAARLWNEAAIARIHALGGTGVRLSHSALFPHMDTEGIRMSALAERMGVTKQAASQLVADLEGMGIVRRDPDPSDGRATLVKLTPAGVDAMRHGLGVLMGMEAEIAAQMGKSEMAALQDSLTRLLAILEPDQNAPSSGGSTKGTP